MGFEEHRLISELNSLISITGKIVTAVKEGLYNRMPGKITGLRNAFMQYEEVLKQHMEVIKDDIHNTNDNHVEIALNDNVVIFSQAVNCCEDICDVLAEIEVDCRSAYIEKTNKLKHLLGKLLLLLKYEILCDYYDEANENGLTQATKILGETSKITGYYYPINVLINHVCRHHFPIYEIKDTAIVMQGPIRYEDDFTIETLYRYRRIYPHTPIVVSTWKNEVTPEFRWKTDIIEVDILENEYPEKIDKYNTNYQLISSYEGMKYVENKYNVNFALKCRTDQRFYLTEFLPYFKSEMKLFPLKQKGTVEERIVFGGVFSSMLSYPFRISDFWSYGKINDLIKLYSAPCPENKDVDAHKKIWEDMHIENEQIIDRLSKEERNKLAKEHEHLLDSEAYIIRSFYENHILGRKLEVDVDDLYMHYWNFIKNYTIIENPDTLAFYWPKYNSAYLRFDSSTYGGALNHTSWVNLLMRENNNLLENC